MSINQRFTLIFFVFAFVFSNATTAKSQNFTKQLIDSIYYYEGFLTINTPKLKQDQANEKILKLIQRIAKQKSAIDVNFDTLRYISVLKSDNKKLQLFTWIIARPMNKYEYYGIVMSLNENTDQYITTVLTDKTSQISAPMRKTLTPNKWYGARYYQLITTKYKGKTTYTALGWKGIDMTQTAKIIEIITLKSNGEINFGYGSFEIKNNEYFKNEKNVKRLIFTYSSEAKMNLIYQQQTILKKVKEGKLKKMKPEYGFIAQQKEVRTEPKYKKIVGKMIVMDQLAPLNPEMENMYAFYVPKINVMDALYFENGKWIYFSDIDARNDNPGAPRKQVINYDLEKEE